MPPCSGPRLVSPRSARLYPTATWTLQARNIGPDLAQSVVVTDTLPSRVSYTSAPGCTYASATRIVRCELASLAAGSTATFTITTSVGKGSGWVTNTAQVTSSTADPSTTNNSATARVLDAAGIQTLVADEAGCCGAIRLHLDDLEGTLHLEAPVPTPTLADILGP